MDERVGGFPLLPSNGPRPDRGAAAGASSPVFISAFIVGSSQTSLMSTFLAAFGASGGGITRI